MDSFPDRKRFRAQRKLEHRSKKRSSSIHAYFRVSYSVFQLISPWNKSVPRSRCSDLSDTIQVSNLFNRGRPLSRPEWILIPLSHFALAKDKTNRLTFVNPPLFREEIPIKARFHKEIKRYRWLRDSIFFLQLFLLFRANWLAIARTTTFQSDPIRKIVAPKQMIQMETIFNVDSSH